MRYNIYVDCPRNGSWLRPALLFFLFAIGLSACNIAQPTLRAFTPLPTANRRILPTEMAKATLTLPVTLTPTREPAQFPPDPAAGETITQPAPASPARPTERINPLSCLPQEAMRANSGEIGLVSWVQDGQTIVVDFQGERRSVRLLGLDAPPIAERKLKELLENQVVRVFREVQPGLQNAADGTPFGYVLTADGSFINFEMLNLGEARLEAQVQEYACQKLFQTAETEAKTAMLGLWGVQAANPLPTEPAPPTQPPSAITPVPATAVALAHTPTTAQSTILPGTPTATLAPGVTPSATPTPGTQTPPGSATATTSTTAATSVTPATATNTSSAPGPRSSPTATRSGEGFTDVDVEIFNIYWSGDPARSHSNEYIELHNTSNAAFDLGGWSVYSDDVGLDVYFPAGFSLGPGAFCRVYTNEIRSDSCGGISFGSEEEIWPDFPACGSLWNSDEEYVAGFCYE